MVPSIYLNIKRSKNHKVQKIKLSIDDTDLNLKNSLQIKTQNPYFNKIIVNKTTIQFRYKNILIRHVQVKQSQINIKKVYQVILVERKIHPLRLKSHKHLIDFKILQVQKRIIIKNYLIKTIYRRVQENNRIQRI